MIAEMKRMGWMIVVVMVGLGSGPGCQRAATVDPATAPENEYTDRDPSTIRRFRFSRPLMGVECRILVEHWKEETARRAAEAAFEEIERINQILSDYLADSEANRLCDRAGTGPVEVSRTLYDALRTSIELTRRTNGAFDVTHGALYQLWREARRSGEWPSAAAIESTRRRGGIEHVELSRDGDRFMVRITQPGLRLDFGGIGKGLAAQRAADILTREQRCFYSLVDLGGDIVANYSPPGRSGWRVLAHSGRAPGDVLVLVLQAMATSGDAEQFMLHEERRYSHIIDPRTGMPLENAPSVTIVAPDGALADALASAVSVLGEEAGQRVAATFEGVGVIVEDAAE